MAELIRKQGGEPFVAPSMREVPLAADAATAQFTERLYAGQFDMMVLLTGVGTRQLHRLLGPRFVEALRAITLAARGPNPPPPCARWARAGGNRARTQHLAGTAAGARRPAGEAHRGAGVRPHQPRIVGRSAPRGAEVTPVRVYQWDLPEDPAPLREAARRLAAGAVRRRPVHHRHPGLATWRARPASRASRCRAWGVTALLRRLHRAHHHRSVGRVRSPAGFRAVASEDGGPGSGGGAAVGRNFAEGIDAIIGVWPRSASRKLNSPATFMKC